MLLISRLATLRGAPSDLLPIAIGLCDRASEVSGLDISLWAGGAGYPTGTMVWSAAVESQAQFAEATQPLLADATYNDLARNLIAHASGDTQQVVRQLIAPEAPPEAPLEVGAAVWVVTAQIANGHLADGMAWAVHIADVAGEATGSQVGVFRDMFGPWGTVTWLTGFDGMAGVDDAMAKLGASEPYLADLDKGASFFNPGSATSGIVSRVH